MKIYCDRCQKLIKETSRGKFVVSWSSKNKKNDSIYRGVKKHSTSWSAEIQKSGKRYYVKDLKSEIEAAKAYNKMARELYGKYAYQNKV